MAEILTESFCERCGTRYTFESPARRSSPIGSALGTVAHGLRNFVVSPDQSIDEAFAVARAETEQRATAHQLEAFHRTFNFCLSCRQYTCGECWNPVDGRCQSCAPMPEAEIAAATATLPDAVFAAPETLSAANSVADAPVVYEAIAIARAAAIPVVEAPPAAIVEAPEAPEETSEADAAPKVAEIVVVEPEAEVTGEVEAEAVPELEEVPEVEPVAEIEAAADVEPAPAPSKPGSLSSLPPGISLDEEIAAYDLRVAALAVPPPPPPAIQPIAASARPMTPSPAPVPAPRIVPAVVPDLPAASEAALPAAQSTGSCASCGLALSATARFCRRCGTAQVA